MHSLQEKLMSCFGTPFSLFDCNQTLSYSLSVTFRYAGGMRFGIMIDISRVAAVVVGLGMQALVAGAFISPSSAPTPGSGTYLSGVSRTSAQVLKYNSDINIALIVKSKGCFNR